MLIKYTMACHAYCLMNNHFIFLSKRQNPTCLKVSIV